MHILVLFPSLTGKPADSRSCAAAAGPAQRLRAEQLDTAPSSPSQSTPHDLHCPNQENEEKELGELETASPGGYDRVEEEAPGGTCWAAQVLCLSLHEELISCRQQQGLPPAPAGPRLVALGQSSGKQLHAFRTSLGNENHPEGQRWPLPHLRTRPAPGLSL